MVMDADARSRIDRFLGRVEAHLADRSEEEREELLRDLESHLHDALAGRETASRADVEAVIAEMDPPESYGDLAPRTPAEPTKTERPPEVKLAIVLVIAGLAGMLLVSTLYELAWVFADEETHRYTYKVVPPRTAWYVFWGCQLTAAAFGLWGALKRIAATPSADRGPALAGLSVALLAGSILLFSGAGMLVDRSAGDLVPLLTVAGLLGTVGAYASGRAAHSARRTGDGGFLLPLARIVPALVSAAVVLILIAAPLAVLREMARDDHAFRRDYDLSDAWPAPLLWMAVTMGIFALEAGLLALLGRVTTVGVRGVVWPVFGGPMKGNGNRGFTVAAGLLAALAAGFLAIWLVWPTPS